MARGRASISRLKGSEAYTLYKASIGPGTRAGFVIVRLHMLLLAPWVVLAVPFPVFFGLGILLVFGIIGIGMAGMFGRIANLATLASVSLLGVLIAGIVGTDLDRLPSQDTAILMIQFVGIIFFMEGLRVILYYDIEARKLAERKDESTELVRIKLVEWVKGQLGRQARLTTGALGLSLFLLVLGGLTSVSISQVAFSASLVLIIVGVLLFIITQRREPVSRKSY